MEDIRKHLGIDSSITVPRLAVLVLEAAQDALDDESHQKNLCEEEDFEMDFGGLDEEQNYALLQVLRRICKVE